MRKFVVAFFVITFPAFFALDANAQMMGRFSNSTADWDEVVEHTIRGEKEGGGLWDKLQTKEISCVGLTDEQFNVLGEYFMGQMMGDSHAAMNAMMIQMLGEEGEEQMHVVMGKRLSGCDTTAAYPEAGRGFMPMMQMMFPLRQGFGGQGGWSGLPNFNQMTNPMMWNYGSGFGWFGLGLGWIFMLFWWLLVIAGIIFLTRWLIRQAKGGTGLLGKSALDIVKERYAKGEITKHEYEEMKREIMQ